MPRDWLIWVWPASPSSVLEPQVHEPLHVEDNNSVLGLIWLGPKSKIWPVSLFWSKMVTSHGIQHALWLFLTFQTASVISERLGYTMCWKFITFLCKVDTDHWLNFLYQSLAMGHVFRRKTISCASIWSGYDHNNPMVIIVHRDEASKIGWRL